MEPQDNNHKKVRIRKAEKYSVNMRVLDENVRTFFMKNFGCCRKVYNLYVDWLYKQLEDFGYVGEDSIPGFKLPEVTEFKKEFDFLKEVDSLGLANAKISFEKAINHFNKECDHKTYTKRARRRDESGTEKFSFRGLVGMPKFHSKAHGDFSYTTNCRYPFPIRQTVSILRNQRH